MLNSYKKFLVSLSTVCIIISSCSNFINDTIEGAKFMSTKLELPSKLLIVEDDTLLTTTCEFKAPTLIAYYGPADCTACIVNRLNDMKRINEFAKEFSHLFNVMIILTPDNNSDELINTLLMRDVDFPIYIDSQQFLYRQNLIPSNSKFHTFLVGGDGTPIVVGDPTKNKRAESTIKEIINSI